MGGHVTLSPPGFCSLPQRSPHQPWGLCSGPEGPWYLPSCRRLGSAQHAPRLPPRTPAPWPHAGPTSKLLLECPTPPSCLPPSPSPLQALQVVPARRPLPTCSVVPMVSTFFRQVGTLPHMDPVVPRMPHAAETTVALRASSQMASQLASPTPGRQTGWAALPTQLGGHRGGSDISRSPTQL